VAFGYLVQRRIRSWWLLLPLAVGTWALVHASGIHPTVAGVLLGFTVPVLRGEQAGGPKAGPGLAEHFEHRFRPISAGVAVPVFAFFAAGVDLGGSSGLREAVTDPVAIGVMLGLVVGKVLGVLGATFAVSRFTRAELDDDLAWTDVLALGLLAGIGFTVSLLIGGLAFGPGSVQDDHVKVAVLVGSSIAAALASLVLLQRNRRHARREG
jgi:NhaA family Na+:H+ antiporter